MNGTKRNNIKIGAAVLVVQKQDQRTGKLTEGIEKKILTNSPEHHHGIKVMLDSGMVRLTMTCGDGLPAREK